MKRYAFPLTIILLLFAVIALAAPGDKRPAVTSAAIGLGTSSSPTLASITATTSVTAPSFNSTAPDGYHYVLPYNSAGFLGTPAVGMFQTTPTGPQWYSSDGWEFLSAFPVQTGNSGKFLTTNGSSVSWATVSSGDSLPTQTGNSGKYLTTNGTAASWGSIAAGNGITISADIPTETGAANLNDTTHVLTVASTTGYTQFTGTHTPWDTTPAAFSFTDETDVAADGGQSCGAAITVAGTNYATTISATGDTGYGYKINGGTFTNASGTVALNDSVAPCVNRSSSNSTATTATITIGGVSDTYSVTTAAASETMVYEEAGTAVGFTNAYSWVGGRYNPASGTEQIVKVAAYITSVTGSPTANVYARIYPISEITDNFHATLDYAPLSGKSVAVASATVTAPGWVEFTFSAPVSITSSTNGYAIVFGPDTPDYTHYLSYANSATTTNGDGLFSDRWVPSTGAYVSGSDKNFSMRIYKQ